MVCLLFLCQLRDVTRAALPVPSQQPQHFHTLWSRRCRMWRPWTYTDSFQEQDVVESFKWRQGIPFGAATSYIHLEKLCEGSSATVYKGISRINGQLVALKVISLETEEGVPFTAIREASLLKHLKHANIVLLHDIIQTKETLTFVLEYMHTDLAQYMAQHPGGLHPCNKIMFCFQLLLSFMYCTHRKTILSQYSVFFILAGLARAKSIPSQTYSSEVVTLWYRPPDVLLGATDYSSNLDIWYCAGCVFVEMIQGQPVFAGTSSAPEQLEKIWTVLGVPTEDTWPGLSKLPKYNCSLAILSLLYPKRVVGEVCLSGGEKKRAGGRGGGRRRALSKRFTGLVEHSNIFSKKWVLLCDPVQDAPPLILVHEH
uniref:Cyclin dependent kinase 15 n=1 Tax=Pavo cristatus TaxID=9049 RepID=A0A8C9G5Q8_PAVCR